MRDFRINTTIGVQPCRPLNRNKAATFITRGSSAVIQFSLIGKAYTYNQIDQLIFALKQPSGKIISYKLYETVDNFSVQSSKFTHRTGVNYDYIELLLDEPDTAALELTTRDSLIEFEVVIQLDGDNNSSDTHMHTTIERQPAIATVDSIYSEMIGVK